MQIEELGLVEQLTGNWSCMEQEYGHSLNQSCKWPSFWHCFYPQKIELLKRTLLVHKPRCSFPSNRINKNHSYTTNQQGERLGVSKVTDFCVFLNLSPANRGGTCRNIHGNLAARAVVRHSDGDEQSSHEYQPSMGGRHRPLSTRLE